MSRPASSRSTYARVCDVIFATGWYIQLVGAGVCDEPGCDGVSDPTAPAFAYTIGLTRYHGHPEIITFNLCPAHFGHTLNLLGEAVAAGCDVTDQSLLDRMFGAGSTRMLRVADSSVHLPGANALYRDPGAPPIPALQLVWSDDNGRFPWQPGYIEDPAMQPLLGEAT